MSSASPGRGALLSRGAVAAGASIFMALEAPPTNWHLLQWVGLVPMLWALREDTPRANRWLGYLYGVVGITALFRWLIGTIDLFSNLPFVLALAILLLFSAVFGAPYAVLWGSVHALRKRMGPWWMLAWPALWVALEYLMMWLFLFPFNHGVGQYRVALTWQITGITGVYGLTFLVFFGNAVLGEWLYRWREGDREPPGFAALGFAATLLAVVSYGSYRYEAVEAALREAPVARMAQLQSRVTMVERLEMGSRRGLAEWVDWTRSIPPDTVDLVVWAEGVAPYLNDRRGRKNPVTKQIQTMARRGGYGMVIGAGTIVDVEDSYEAYNSVYAFGRDGEMIGQYDKLVPLPFGEYFPLGEYVPWLADAIGGIGNFRAGEQPVVLDVDGIRVAAPICYEAILPRVCRWFHSPDLLVNVTNDAWFGETAAPYQHGMLAASRSTELGVPLVRSTYSGISFVSEPHGHIYAEAPLFTETRRRVDLRMKTFPTLYSRFGDWFVGVCVLGLAGLWVAGPRLTGRD